MGASDRRRPQPSRPSDVSGPVLRHPMPRLSTLRNVGQQRQRVHGTELRRHLQHLLEDSHMSGADDEQHPLIGRVHGAKEVLQDPQVPVVPGVEFQRSDVKLVLHEWKEATVHLPFAAPPRHGSGREARPPG